MSYGEKRHTRNLTTQESCGGNEKTVSQKMASSYSLQMAQVEKRKADKRDLHEGPGESKQAEYAEDPKRERAGVLVQADGLN